MIKVGELTFTDNAGSSFFYEDLQKITNGLERMGYVLIDNDPRITYAKTYIIVKAGKIDD